MTKSFAMTEDDLFEEVVERGKMDMVNTHEGFDALVDAVVEDHLDFSEIDVDNDTEGIADHLKERWPEYETRLAED